MPSTFVGKSNRRTSHRVSRRSVQCAASQSLGDVPERADFCFVPVQDLEEADLTRLCDADTIEMF